MSVYFRIRSKEAEKEEVYENVSTFSALSGDSHRFLWSGFVLVSDQATTASLHSNWSMLYVSSYLDNETF